MKTLRELLLDRHADAVPRLDRLRRETLAGLERSGPVEIESSRDGFRAWRAMIARACNAWLGIGATALVGLGLNLAVPTSPEAPRKAPPSVWASEARRERAQLVAELLNGPSGDPHGEVAPVGPTSRSEKRRSSLGAPGRRLSPFDVGTATDLA